MTPTVRPVTTAAFDAAVLGAPRPVLAYFWAAWCAQCRAVKPLVEALAAEYAGRADVVSVDVETEPEVAERFGVRSLPTFVVFDGGEVVDGVVGAVVRGSLTSRLDARLDARLSPETPAGS